jgi:hypothetical protein
MAHFLQLADLRKQLTDCQSDDERKALLQQVHQLAQAQCGQTVAFEPQTFEENMRQLQRLMSHTTAWNGNDNETVRHAMVLTSIMLSQLTR